jgi:hypothetical protein
LLTVTDIVCTRWPVVPRCVSAVCWAVANALVSMSCESVSGVIAAIAIS